MEFLWGVKQVLTDVGEEILSYRMTSTGGKTLSGESSFDFVKLLLGGIQAHILDPLIELYHSPFSENSYSKNLKVKSELPFL